MLAAVVSSGCGPRPVDVAGTWEGTWTSADHQSRGTFRVEIQQRRKVIKGTIELSLDWLPQARIDGVVEGSRVRWGVLRGGLVVLTFEGSVSGDAAEGTYSFGQAGEGTWTARRTGRP
ncbi:MAG: hypothetical protein Q8N53_14295 [Longimicrobiales bacterium]|nr:hypothetical protein [Longimicrobiales bacterium]